MPIEERIETFQIITADSLTWRVPCMSWSSGGGPDKITQIIVFSHGVTMHKGCYAAVAATMIGNDETIRVVAFDWLGHGEWLQHGEWLPAAGIGGEYTQASLPSVNKLIAYCEVVFQVIHREFVGDSEGVRLHFIGESMGASIPLITIANNHESLRALRIESLHFFGIATLTDQEQLTDEQRRAALTTRGYHEEDTSRAITMFFHFLSGFMRTGYCLPMTFRYHLAEQLNPHSSFFVSWIPLRAYDLVRIMKLTYDAARHWPRAAPHAFFYKLTRDVCVSPTHIESLFNRLRERTENTTLIPIDTRHVATQTSDSQLYHRDPLFTHLMSALRDFQRGILSGDQFSSRLVHPADNSYENNYYAVVLSMGLFLTQLLPAKNIPGIKTFCKLLHSWIIVYSHLHLFDAAAQHRLSNYLNILRMVGQIIVALALKPFAMNQSHWQRYCIAFQTLENLRLLLVDSAEPRLAQALITKIKGQLLQMPRMMCGYAGTMFSSTTAGARQEITSSEDVSVEDDLSGILDLTCLMM